MSNTATSTPTQFNVGTEYTTGRNGDYIWTFTVVARTAKFVTLQDEEGDLYRVGIYVWGDTEAAMPFGKYSMAPTINAGRLA